SGLTEEEIERMKNEAKANAEADKREKERIDKINAADSLIFQTEKQLKEYGDKLSEGNKTAIKDSLENLKNAHKSQDLAAIDKAMEALNAAWQNAAQEMYSAGQAGAGPNMGGQPGGQQSENQSGAEDVSDVEYEEVNDKNKKE